MRRICLYSANKIKSSESGSKQPILLIVELNSLLWHIIVTKTTTKNTIGQNSRIVALIVSGSCQQHTGTTEMQPDFFIWKIKLGVYFNAFVLYSLYVVEHVKNEMFTPCLDHENLKFFTQSESYSFSILHRPFLNFSFFRLNHFFHFSV